MNFVDMSAFIGAKSDQLNADDLGGGPITVTVTRVSANPDSTEQPVSVSYEGDDGKPFKPCKTMRRVMVAVWGADASRYVGRSMTLFKDPKVQFGGMATGGVRISHMSHIDNDVTPVLMVTRGKRAPYKVQPLKVEQPAPADDPAFTWANGYIARLAKLATIDAVAAFEAEKAGKLAELGQKRADLHKRVTDALASRYKALANDGTLSADNPAAAEGRDDDDFGERITDDLIAGTSLSDSERAMVAAREAAAGERVS